MVLNQSCELYKGVLAENVLKEQEASPFHPVIVSCNDLNFSQDFVTSEFENFDYEAGSHH